MIKAVVFDMGGVLHTVARSREKYLQYAGELVDFLAQHGISIPDPPPVLEEKLKAADAARRRANEESLRETPPLEAWTEFYLKEYGVTREQIFPIADELCLRWSRDRGFDSPRPGLAGCLQELRDQGMRLGIISNTLSRTYVFSQLSDYGVSRFFECVLLSSVCGLRKPGREIFDLCCQTMNLPPREMAYVGDTISRDVIGVRRAGWKTMIRLAHPQAKPEVLEREQKLMDSGYKPDYDIEALGEIPEIIRRCNRGEEEGGKAYD